jgi:hypothetical protein
MAAVLDDSRTHTGDRCRRKKLTRSRKDGTMEPTTTINRHEASDEDQLIHDWRAAQLKRLGTPEWLADIVADRIDWHEIAALVERGCSARLAVDIVR